MPIHRASGVRSSDVRKAAAVAVAITIQVLRVGSGSGVVRAAGLPPPGGPVTTTSVVAAAPSDDPFAVSVAREVTRLDEAAGRPEAVGPLVALMELADTQPVGRLDPVIRRLVEQRGTDPLVAARARDWLARRAEAEGNEAAGANWRSTLGILSRLWVIGPFGDGRGSFGVGFPPEAEAGAPDPARSYQGKEREVTWRRGDGAVYGGALHLDALLRPDTEAVGYAEALVHVARPMNAALRVGSAGPIKVWCNGRQVFAADRARPARFDQDAVAVRLEAGWNRLLIKTVVSAGAWQLFARLTAPDGDALAFENDWTAPASSSAGAAGRPVGRAPPRRSGQARDLETILRRRAQDAPARVRAEAWLDLGRYLMNVESPDRDEKAAAAAFEASASATPSVSALLGLAAAAREEDERRRALERALEIAKLPSERARVMGALGDVARDQRRPAAAAELWRAALAADPHCWPASLSVAAEEQAADLTTVALARLDALAASAREIPLVVRERARLLTVLGRREEAERELRRLLPHARDDIELLRELGAFAWDRGDVAGTEDALAEAARQRPDLPSFTIDLAHHLEGQGRGDEAQRKLEEAARRMPHEFSLAAELGRLLDRQGQETKALTWLQTGRDLRPQDVDLRRYADAARVREAARSGVATSASSADATNVVDLAKVFAASVPDLLAKEAARPAAPPPPSASGGQAPGMAGREEDPAVVLLDRRVVRVHANGLAETFSQRVTAIRTDAGARDNKEFYVRYTPGSEEVEIREARIFRRDASGAWQTLQASGRDDQDLSEPWYGLYYDFRAEVVAFEGLRAGDVLEIEYVVSDVSRENQLAGYFGDLQFVAEGIPKRRWDYTLLGPPGREFHFARPAVAHLDSSVADEHGERVYRFTATDVPRIEAEPAMPGLAEVSPYLHVSTYRTWEEVGAWYWRLVEEQLVADDAIRRAAAAAIRPTARGPLTDLEKVRALHALVVGGTRYVGLEFGIHGFKPYKVAQILSRRFGDCKDKAALLVAMLREAGIEAEMVLLRTRRGGRLATLPASLAIFDHAIVFVPKLGLYLDGTAEFSGMDELPGQDQGVMVLRVGPRGAHLGQTPVLPSTKNRAQRRWRVTVEADGSADVREELTLTGQAAPEWREHYQTAGERDERYGKAFSARNPGAHLLSVEMPGIEDRNRPVTVLAHATVPGLGERIAGDGLKLGLGTREVDLARTYARLSDRRAALVLAYPWQHEEEIDYQLPRGFEVTHLPAPRRIESSFGSFELRTEKRGPGEVRVAGILNVERDRVSAAEYPAFRRFLATVDSIMAEGITAVPVTAHARAAGPSAALAAPAPGRPAVP
jgi:tetratricopeptide (TPR) repeat protein